MQAHPLLIAALLAGCASNQTTQPPIATTPSSATENEKSDTPKKKKMVNFRDLTAAEKTLIARGVSQGLKDPDSAQFKWSKVGLEMDDLSMIPYCATLNAKNSYGGYIGFQPYYAMILTKDKKIIGAALIGTGGNRSSTETIIETCSEHGLDPYNTH